MNTYLLTTEQNKLIFLKKSFLFFVVNHPCQNSSKYNFHPLHRAYLILRCKNIFEEIYFFLYFKLIF